MTPPPSTHARVHPWSFVSGTPFPLALLSAVACVICYSTDPACLPCCCCVLLGYTMPVVGAGSSERSNERTTTKPNSRRCTCLCLCPPSLPSCAADHVPSCACVHMARLRLLTGHASTCTMRHPSQHAACTGVLFSRLHCPTIPPTRGWYLPTALAAWAWGCRYRQELSRFVKGLSNDALVRDPLYVVYNRAALDKISKKFDKNQGVSIRKKNWQITTAELGSVFRTILIDDWSLIPPDLHAKDEDASAADKARAAASRTTTFLVRATCLARTATLLNVALLHGTRL